ncbi:hypothetical protein SDJN02_16676, partial [Cucurbita argyrosperma subsp. argyrosperma]
MVESAPGNLGWRQDKNLWEESDYPVRHSPTTSLSVYELLLKPSRSQRVLEPEARGLSVFAPPRNLRRFFV